METTMRNQCCLEVHFGRAQWVATDCELTARDIVLMLLASGHSHGTIRVRTGDDQVGSKKWAGIARNIAELTGTTYIY